MRLGLCQVAAGAAALSVLPTVHAWGAAGHEIVATIAQIHLHPTVLPALCAILDPESDNPKCHLAQIATWADRIRNTAGFRWSASLHYVGARDDYPSDTCAFPGDRGWAGRAGANVLGATRNVTNILSTYSSSPSSSSDALAAEALKFLVHFLGDLHMPLHLTGRLRGGNGAKVTFDGRLSNLHSVWDGLLIAKALRTLPHNYTRPLPVPGVERALRGTIYDPYVRRVMFEGLMEGGRWHDDAEEWLACPAEVPGARAVPETLYAQLKQVLFGTLPFGLASRPAAEETDDDTVCPYHWAAPIHQLNCDLIWPKALDEPPYLTSDAAAEAPHAHHMSAEEELAQFDDAGNYVGGPRKPYPWLELDTPEYTGVIAEQYVVERLVAMGGIRLAGVLNWLFADVDEFARQRPFIVMP